MAEGRPLKIAPPRLSSNPLNRLKMRYQTMDAYSRHKQLINNYCLYYSGSVSDKFKRDDSKDKNDYDIIRENHKFLWSVEDVSEAEKSWDLRLAKKYYDKLFKEYCIADLSQYEKNRVAMRWRTEMEVKNGKGQFVCGEKHCNNDKGLESWEVNFSYIENGEKKHALVKLRLCPECSAKLNFHSMKKKVSREQKKAEKRKKQKQEKNQKKSKTESTNDKSSSENSDSEEERDTTELRTQQNSEDVMDNFVNNLLF